VEIGAARARSVEELWGDFGFMSAKLNFAQVRLTLAGEERVWEVSDKSLLDQSTFRRRMELRVDGPCVLEFHAPKQSMNGSVFDQLTELASECWLNSTTRFQSATGLPIRFDSQVSPAFALAQRQTG
jgi:hypothetical protein